MTISEKGINWFLPEILKINKSWNPSGPETKIGHTQSRVVVLDATFPQWFSPFKNKRNWPVLSSDIADQRILQSDWMRHTTGHNQSKLVLRGAT